MGPGGRRGHAGGFAAGNNFLNLPPSVLGPLQGLLFTGLVLIFMFLRPQGLLPAGDLWRATGDKDTR